VRIDAISIGNNPPEDINVIIEVPLGGQPIKYEMDKDAGRFLKTAIQSMFWSLILGSLYRVASSMCGRLVF